MFKDKKKDWTHTGINLKHNKSNLQSDGPSSFYLWTAGLPHIALPRKKKNTS